MGVIYPSTLKQFLLHGRLGAIKIGMSRLEVEKLLGAPPNFSFGTQSNHYSDALQWHYGSTVLVWDSPLPHDSIRLKSIRMGLLDDEIELPPSIQKTGYYPNASSTPDEFEQYLKSEALDYRKDEADPIIQPYFYDKMIYFFVGAVGKVCFTLKDGEYDLYHIVYRVNLSGMST